jgi:hypothetical protein
LAFERTGQCRIAEALQVVSPDHDAAMYVVAA